MHDLDIELLLASYVTFWTLSVSVWNECILAVFLMYLFESRYFSITIWFAGTQQKADVMISLDEFCSDEELQSPMICSLNGSYKQQVITICFCCTEKASCWHSRRESKIAKEHCGSLLIFSYLQKKPVLFPASSILSRRRASLRKACCFTRQYHCLCHTNLILTISQGLTILMAQTPSTSCCCNWTKWLWWW